MKNLKEKFKNHVSVKPLYKKLKNRNKTQPQIHIVSVTSVKQDGHEIKLKEHVKHVNKVFRIKHPLKNENISLGDKCESYNKDNIFEQIRAVNEVHHGLKERRMADSDSAVINVTNNQSEIEDKRNKLVQADDHKIQKVPCTWLRLYPAPQLPDETIGSVVLRCMFCLVGLLTFLVLWTTLWIFVIQYYEGPNEIKVYREFERQRNQLVIDLATELRQISPVSRRWKSAIDKRIAEVSEIISEAVLRGARMQPGQYWNLSGTFLFTVYVMTALGFGAPVPQTTEGRTAGLIYALVAIPVQFYFMMNASMNIVIHVQSYAKHLRSKLRDKGQFIGRTATFDYGTTNSNRNSEVLKTLRRCHIGSKIMRCMSAILCACHSLPLVIFLYYLAGACIFRTLLDLKPLDMLMFPLEFTTSGRLDHIPGHIRVLYGFYIEGAVTLLGCVVANLRRYSISTIKWASEKYRLYVTEDSS